MIINSFGFFFCPFQSFYDFDIHSFDNKRSSLFSDSQSRSKIVDRREEKKVAEKGSVRANLFLVGSVISWPDTRTSGYPLYERHRRIEKRATVKHDRPYRSLFNAFARAFRFIRRERTFTLVAGNFHQRSRRTFFPFRRSVWRALEKRPDPGK